MENKLCIQNNSNNNIKAIIPVRGGLGNQMFFYAFSLYLKANNINSLLVWHEYIFTKQHNGVELFDVFEIPIDNYNKFKISFFLKLNRSFLSHRIKRIIGRIFRCKYIFIKNYKQSSSYSFDDLFAIRKSKISYVEGFWQNYRYLMSIRNILLESFCFRLPVGFDKNIFLNEIQSSASVAIHIRRGDYLNPAFSELNVIRYNEYYLKAINYIEENIKNPKYFIFTDDMLWAKMNFKGDKYVFVEGNINENSHLDLFLMSICKHNIIANSTFSFWGAWLNVNPTKIVIVPKMWTINNLSSELCPPDWIYL